MSTQSQNRNSGKNRLPQQRGAGFGLLVVVMLVMGLFVPMATSAQDAATPEPEQGDTTPEAQNEESTSSSSSPSGDDTPLGTDPGSPAVLAQGLAYLSGDDVVWQVTDYEYADGEEAQSTSGGAALILQTEGQAIIRNDVTGKRTLLAPGQAFFRAAGDAYTLIAQSSSSRAWILETPSPDDAGGREDGVIFLSADISDLGEGTYDFQLTRFVLSPGEEAEVPPHTGTALLMSTNGDVQVADKGTVSAVTSSNADDNGKLVTSDAVVSNSTTSPVEYVVASYGTKVGDETSRTGTASNTPEETPEASTDDSSAEAPADDSASADDSTSTDDGSDSGSNGGSQYVTSINITATESDIYVRVIADGVTVFDSTIPAGGMSGVIVGSTFEVYTSYGAGTQFTDACGATFFMGYEGGEAYYTLAANENSCAP